MGTPLCTLRGQAPPQPALCLETAGLKEGMAQLCALWPELLALAETEENLRRLGREIERTRRRVGALEHVLIPNLSRHSAASACSWRKTTGQQHAAAEGQGSVYCRTRTVVKKTSPWGLVFICPRVSCTAGCWRGRRASGLGRDRPWAKRLPLLEQARVHTRRPARIGYSVGGEHRWKSSSARPCRRICTSSCWRCMCWARC
ncbi:MAG: V-type ATP synthase subunit D [Christensenellales bacterium]